MRQQLVVGDIHGCVEEFRDLLAASALGDGDGIVSVGDLVDRGPDSGAVLDFFRSTPGASAVMGNHERKNVRSYRGEIRPARSQELTRRQLGETAYAEACAFMSTLPISLDLPEALIVHGFWAPGLTLGEQHELVLIGTMTGEQMVNRACPSGRWYEHYEGSKPLIVGHRDYLRSGQPLVHRDTVFGLDTSCVYGGRLTGLLLPSFRFVSVPARQAYWPDTRNAHRSRASSHDVADECATRPQVK